MNVGSKHQQDVHTLREPTAALGERKFPSPEPTSFQILLTSLIKIQILLLLINLIERMKHFQNHCQVVTSRAPATEMKEIMREVRNVLVI